MNVESGESVWHGGCAARTAGVLQTLLLPALLLSGAPAMAAGKKAGDAGERVLRAADDERPDFSAVTSRAAAERLVRDGRLVRVLIIPEELGGADTPKNRAYVPPAVEVVLSMLHGTMVRFAAEGLINWMDVSQDFGGKSIVPRAIRYQCESRDEATGKPRGKGRFNPSVEVW